MIQLGDGPLAINSPLDQEVEVLSWEDEIEKVKAILPELPTNPQPWRPLDPALVRYITIHERHRLQTRLISDDSESEEDDSGEYLLFKSYPAANT
jgi:hypothetical protein